MSSPGKSGRVASWVRAVRQSKGQSQQAAADACGVHRTTVARWEGGVRVPRAGDMYTLAGWAEVPASEVIALCCADAAVGE